MNKKLKIFLLTLVFAITTGSIYAFDKKGNTSFITEVKTGIVAHDAGIFGRQKEEGLDSTFEFLFREINYICSYNNISNYHPSLNHNYLIIFEHLHQTYYIVKEYLVISNEYHIYLINYLMHYDHYQYN